MGHRRPLEKLVIDAFWNGSPRLPDGPYGLQGRLAAALWLKRLGATVGLRPTAIDPAIAVEMAAGVGEQIESHSRRHPRPGRLADALRSPGRRSSSIWRPSPWCGCPTRAGRDLRINVMGTVHVLEAGPAAPSVALRSCVTTDKCYENREWVWGYRENDPMGGYDPYSNSKGCAELVTSSYRQSYFSHLKDRRWPRGEPAMSSAAATGRSDRLVPDLIAPSPAKTARRSASAEIACAPGSTCLSRSAAISAGRRARRRFGQAFSAAGLEFWSERRGQCRGWPGGRNACRRLGRDARYEVRRDPNAVHEATLLTLDQTKAQRELNWRPRWSLEQTLQNTAAWYRAYYASQDMAVTGHQQL
jgi:CDP-glucose 4,6-dehydratase